MPGEKGIRLGNTRDLLESFASQSFGNLGQDGSLGIRQAEPGRQVGSEDAVLGHQVFVSEQQFLIDEPRHVSEQTCPMESIAHERKVHHRPLRDGSDARLSSAPKSDEYFYYTGIPLTAARRPDVEVVNLAQRRAR